MAFSHNAPCPNCANRLISSGVTEVYCYFEPEEMGGIQLLGKHGIPVFKYQLVSKSLRLINELQEDIAFKFTYEVTYNKENIEKKITGELLGTGAEQVILSLLEQYPDCKGIVKRVKS